MNRRGFLQIVLLGHSFWLSSLFKFTKKQVKVTYESIPKNQCSSYRSVTDFFSNFYGDYSGIFNRQNMQAGRILSVKSYFSPNKKTVLAEYVYTDRKAFMECESIWEKRYPKSKDPVKHIVASIV